MEHLHDKSESDLKYLHDTTYDSYLLKKIEEEMDFRSIPFKDKSVGQYDHEFELGVIIFILKIIGLSAVACLVYKLIQYPLKHYFEIAEQYFPAKYYMEGNIVGNKIQMNIVGFMVACGVTIALFKFGKDIRKIAAFFFVVMSIYFLVDEIKTKDVPFSAIILSGLVILIALSGAIKFKRCTSLGLWLIASTTIGFIIIGNHILTPWVFLETAGFLLVFVRDSLLTFIRKG
ncbi:hypothetical protein ACTFO3_25855 [Bacillus cereus group sp. MYBK69-2]|uniref:hypothetical protein n=1 Tax=unclassified Bacillus cereus group TaxID=2750818 RepID=UPI003F78E89B